MRASRLKSAQRRWQIAPPPGSAELTLAAQLAAALRVSPVCARMLLRRGCSDHAAAEAFLSRSLDRLHPPELLPDMAAAVARIAEAVEKGQRIVLFGDYDVDGLAATALLERFFRLLKSRSAHPFQIIARVPERAHGYGLGAQAAAAIRQAKPDLLITLDNGIAAHDCLAALAGDGVDCIVVDHHHIGASLPRAVAVVNPRRCDNGNAYPFTDLCAAAIAFKLAWALAVYYSHDRRVSPEFRAFLLDAIALAGAGTLADVAPLAGENRILAHQGLRALARTQMTGLRVLMQECGIADAPQVRDVTHRLAPRLNAAGRCGEAAAALELLLTEDPARARDLAAVLEGYNTERQDIEKRIHEQAREQAQAALHLSPECAAFVLDSHDWHPGIIGIVASRIVEEFHRPALLLSVDQATQVARGSGRSIRGLHLAETLAATGGHLIQFGGHAAAAGFSVQAARIAAFRLAFQETAAALLHAEDFVPTLHVDEQIALTEVDVALCADLEKLEPCGVGNPQAVFAALGVSIASPPKLMGRDQSHVSFYVKQGTTSRRVVAFGAGEHFNALCELGRTGTLDIAFRPRRNAFRGEESAELILADFRAGA